MYDLFSSLNGFARNALSKPIEVEDEVRADLIKVIEN